MPAPHPPPAPAPARTRTSVAIALGALVVVVALAAGCGTDAARPDATTVPVAGPEAGVTSHYGTDAGPSSQPTTKAALAATHAFAATVDQSTASFVAAVTQLQADVTAGDTTGARADELAAQGDYDAFRELETGNTINAESLDELASDVGPDQSFGGLHAVERDLWSVGPLASDVSGLAGQAPVAQYVLSRERLGPEAIGSVAVDELSWVVDVALPDSQEQYSHRGLVDVAATEQAAASLFAILLPLGRLVDPALTGTVQQQFATLAFEVAALGPPGSTPDTSVPAGVRLSLSEQLDATASTLARLVATFTPYGTAGSPS